jgi:hypothetical protein
MMFNTSLWRIDAIGGVHPIIGDVPLDVENCGAGVAWVDGYAAFDASSRPECLA